MPPKTRMNESQVRLNRQRKKHEWENRTGLILTTEEEYQEMRRGIPLLSIIGKFRNSWWQMRGR